jgi:hypothetical protein
MVATADARMLLSILSVKSTTKLMSSLQLNAELAKLPRTGRLVAGYMRRFSASVKRRERRDLQTLPAKHLPIYQGRIF